MEQDITFTSLEPSDWRSLHELCTHPDVVHWTDSHPAEPAEVYQKKLNDAQPHRGHYYIAARVGERIVGFAWLTIPANLRGRRTAQLSLVVHPELWRRKIGGRLLREVLSIADRWLDLIRVTVDVPFDAEAALSLLQKNGFLVEVRRREDLLRRGLYIDMIHLSRLRPGFEQRPEEITSPPAWPVRQRTSKEIKIRTATVEDANAHAESFQDPSAYWGTFQLPYPPKDMWRKRLAPSEELRHMLVAEIDGKVVGNSGLHGFKNPRRAHCWWLGIGVHVEYQGVGVGDRLMSALMELADHWLGAKRIELGVYVDNARAIKLYERHGFVAEGVQRCLAFRDGSYVDTLVMARIVAPRG